MSESCLVTASTRWMQLEARLSLARSAGKEAGAISSGIGIAGGAGGAQLLECRAPPIGMPNLPWDVILAQASQLTYMIGVAVLVLEKVIAVVMMVIGVEIGAMPLQPGRERVDV